MRGDDFQKRQACTVVDTVRQEDNNHLDYIAHRNIGSKKQVWKA
jgi:hypothetical protein